MPGFFNPLFPSLAGFQSLIFRISGFSLRPKAQIWKAEIAGFQLLVFLHFSFQLSTFSFSSVAGGADPGSSAERLTERFFGLRISGFAAIVLKDVVVRLRSTPADETSAFPGGADPGAACGLSRDH